MNNHDLKITFAFILLVMIVCAFAYAIFFWEPKEINPNNTKPYLYPTEVIGIEYDTTHQYKMEGNTAIKDSLKKEP